MPDPLQQLRDELVEVETLRRRADEVMDGAVARAREQGITWAQIGDVIGVTRQAAQQRFSGWPDRADAAVQDAVDAAARLARTLGHRYVAPEHLLLALAEQRGELAARVLHDLGVSAGAIREGLLARLGDRSAEPAAGSLGVAPETKRVLDLARTFARRLGHRCARTEHVLLALAHPWTTAGPEELLARNGVTVTRVREEVAAALELEAPELAARLRARGALRRRR